MTSLVQTVAQLRAIDPRLPYLLTAAVVGAVIWAWRVVSPGTFDQVPTRVRALPAAAIGAILTAGATESLNTVLIDLVFGAFAGVTAVGGHETLRRLVSGEGQTPAPGLSPEQLAELAKQLAPRYAPPVVVQVREGEEAAPPVTTEPAPPAPVPDAGDPANEK